MFRIAFSAILLIILLVITGCSSNGAVVGGASTGSLTGKVWALTTLNGKTTAPNAGISALFTTNGKVSGSSGCNQYSTSYTTSGSNITITAPAASTMMMCEQAVMDQETAYLKALGDAKTYAIHGDQLTLSGADKTILAVYQAQGQDLAGTSWEAIGYNNGKQAVTSVSAGSAIAANFGKDGQLTGNGGCNDYNGPYKVNGNQISIGPLAATMKACEQAVMDQETLYLAALQTAATYQIEGKTLELRDKDGALAVDFTKK